MIRALGKHNGFAYKIDKNFIKAPQEFKEKAALLEYECPYCHIPVQLVSFKDGNEKSPHFKATGNHTHAPECAAYQVVEDMDITNRMRTYKAGKALAVMDSEVVDFNKEVKMGVIYRVQAKDLDISRTWDFNGMTYVEVKLGNPFSKGVLFRVPEHAVKLAPNEEIIFMAEFKTKKIITSKKNGREYTIFETKPHTFKFGKPVEATMDRVPWEDPFKGGQ